MAKEPLDTSENLGLRRAEAALWKTRLGSEIAVPAAQTDAMLLVLDKVHHEIAGAAAAGRLRTYYREIYGGPHVAVPSLWWQLDNPKLRFRNYMIDPAEPFSSNEGTHWIFVSRADFAFLVRGDLDYKTPSSERKLSPYLRFMIDFTERHPVDDLSIAALAAQCQADWLRQTGNSLSAHVAESMARLLKKPDPTSGRPRSLKHSGGGPRG